MQYYCLSCIRTSRIMKINLTREKTCNVAKTMIGMTVTGPVTLVSRRPVVTHRVRWDTI